MPRFVVLKHEKESGAHFDLMLENEGVLLTYCFPAFPSPGASCERLADHRIEYLDYEGEVGGDRGTVTRVEGGTFDLLSAEDNAVFAFLRGDRLQGEVRLRLQNEDTWTFEPE